MLDYVARIAENFVLLNLALYSHARGLLRVDRPRVNSFVRKIHASFC